MATRLRGTVAPLCDIAQEAPLEQCGYGTSRALLMPATPCNPLGPLVKHAGLPARFGSGTRLAAHQAGDENNFFVPGASRSVGLRVYPESRVFGVRTPEKRGDF
jgi:hypothetical protein